MPAVADDDVQPRTEDLCTTAGLFGNAKPTPKRKRKSRAKVPSESETAGCSLTDASSATVSGHVAGPRTLIGSGGSVQPKVPCLDAAAQLTPHDRRTATMAAKHRPSPVRPAMGKPTQHKPTQHKPTQHKPAQHKPTQQVQEKKKSTQPGKEKKKTKRRCRKRDPAEQPSQPWTEREIAQFRALIKAEGATAWKDKSAKLAKLCGNVRTPKALHTRYLREIGRIVDRPRCAGLLRHARKKWLR